MTDDLINRLRNGYEQDEDDDRIITTRMIEEWYIKTTDEAANALEAQAKRIAELGAALSGMRDVAQHNFESACVHQTRAEKAEADLAAARAALRHIAHALGLNAYSRGDAISDAMTEHASAIAAARGEKPKSDACPTCGGEGSFSEAIFLVQPEDFELMMMYATLAF